MEEFHGRLYGRDSEMKAIMDATDQVVSSMDTNWILRKGLKLSWCLEIWAQKSADF